MRQLVSWVISILIFAVARALITRGQQAVIATSEDYCAEVEGSEYLIRHVIMLT